MSRSEGFAVMDVSTDIVNDPKFRRLARLYPDVLGGAFMVYTAMLAESWKAGRRVSIDDAWPVLLPFDKHICIALNEVGLADRNGLVQSKAWTSWYRPAFERREALRAKWRSDKARANPSTKLHTDSTDTGPYRTGPSEPTGPIPLTPAVGDDLDALDLFYSLTGWKPWGVEFSGDVLKAAINDYTDLKVQAAMRSEWDATHDKKGLIKGTIARLQRDADRAKEAARLERKPKPRIVVDDAERARVAAELGRPA